MSDAHETYLVCQACPGYVPSADEADDFQLRVMAEIHQMYENRKLKQLGEMLAKMLGATDG